MLTNSLPSAVIEYHWRFELDNISGSNFYLHPIVFTKAILHLFWYILKQWIRQYSVNDVSLRILYFLWDKTSLAVSSLNNWSRVWWLLFFQCLILVMYTTCNIVAGTTWWSCLGIDMMLRNWMTIPPTYAKIQMIPCMF